MKRHLSTLAVLALLLSAVLLPQAALAQTTSPWQVSYFNNTNWSGAPVYTEYANAISYNWGSDMPPVPNMPSQNWSARLTTNSFFYAGNYTFQIVADDAFILYVDGVMYANTVGQNIPGKPVTISVPLVQGNHTIQIDYVQFTGPAYLYASWQYFKPAPGPAPLPIPPTPAPPPPPPSGTIFPPPSSGPNTQFGNYTNCAQQQIHQSNCFVSNGAWDAPNMGSIQMEPQIVVWQNCKADQTQRMQLFPNKDPQNAKCSKTEAGWFPS